MSSWQYLSRSCILSGFSLLVWGCVEEDIDFDLESDTGEYESDSGVPEASTTYEPRDFPLPDDPNPYWCHNICSYQSSCSSNCDQYPFGSSTCGNYGLCSDLDGDGVDHGEDNCSGTYNPGQENCDGDSKGDACDALDATVDTETIVQYQYSEWGPGSICSCDGVFYGAIWDVYYEYLETSTTYCAGPQAGQTDTDLDYQGSFADFACYWPQGGCPIGQFGCNPGNFTTC